MANLTFSTTYLKGKGKLRLTKSFFADGSKESYPNAKNFSSESKKYDKTSKGLKQRLEDLKAAASKGKCLLKGDLDKDLEEEPRAGHCLRSKPNSVLTLDIDNLEVDLRTVDGFDRAEMEDAQDLKQDAKTPAFIDTAKSKLGRKQIECLAEYIVQTLPDKFQKTSYFIHASSSMGTKGKHILSMHLEFILDEPVAPYKQKDWLVMYNLTSSPFKERLELGVTGLALRYPLDITVADNSKLIFIGHPYFQESSANPIQNKDRILLVEKSSVMLDSTVLRAASNPATIKTLKEDTIKELRKKAGLKAAKASTRTITRGDKKVELLRNPDAMAIEIVDDSTEFVHCNINGGDSNGYYFLKNDPSLMHNFKDEPMFRIQDANEEFYLEMIERFADEISSRQGRQYLVVRDANARGKINAVELDANARKIYYHSQFDDKQAAIDWAAQYGEVLGDSIPYAFIDYNPKVSDVIERRKPSEGAKEEVFINTYMESDLWLKADRNLAETPNLNNGPRLLKDMCPNISFLMKHVVAGEEEYKNFLNWIATALATKSKIGTTWLFQGVQGTGKGILYKEILQPLFGKQNSKMSKIDELEDRFDDQFSTKTLVIIDEFRHSEAQGSKKLESRLKMMATEAEYSTRAMHKAYQEAENFFNMIFFSNAGDAVRIEESDRRWNIAPRQRTSLRQTIAHKTEQNAMEIIANMVENIRIELPTVANFFKAYDYNMLKAMTAIDNDAKKILKASSRTRLEDFTAAILLGDASWFIEASETYSGENPKLRSELKRALLNIIDMTDYAEGTTIVSYKDLAPFYSIAQGKDRLESVAAARKYIGRHARDAVIDAGTKRTITDGFEAGSDCSVKFRFIIPTVLSPIIADIREGHQQPNNIRQLS